MARKFGGNQKEKKTNLKFEEEAKRNNGTATATHFVEDAWNALLGHN